MFLGGLMKIDSYRHYTIYNLQSICLDYLFDKSKLNIFFNFFTRKGKG